MKLQTSIQARRDGTLTVQGLDGKPYTFTKDAEGVLTGDVTDEATVAHLLAGGDFYPENPEDYDAAMALVPKDEDEGDEVDEDDEGEGEGGLPVEANSPLKPMADPKAGGKPRKAGGKPRKAK